MKKYALLLRVNKKPLNPQQLELRTQMWGELIKILREEGKFIESQIFDEEAFNISGISEKKINNGPICDHDEIMGGMIIIQAADLDEALEISRRCPTLDFGGSVEIRNLKPSHVKSN
jgi:hypothetical protein